LVRKFFLSHRFLLFTFCLQEPENRNSVMILMYGVNTEFKIHRTEFSSTSSANVIFKTPSYPEKSTGMILRLNRDCMVLYHYEFLSGLLF
jgi:hypothetical protein